MWELFRKLQEVERLINEAQSFGNGEIREDLKKAVLSILDAQEKIYEHCD